MAKGYTVQSARYQPLRRTNGVEFLKNFLKIPNYLVQVSKVGEPLRNDFGKPV